MEKSLVASEPALLEAQLKAALNLIPAHTWYAAPSGALIFLNERGSDYLGLPQDHPLRLGIDTGAAWDPHISLLHPDDHGETRRVWSTCLRTSCAGQVSCRIRSAEGGYRWFLSRAEPVRASDGTLLYWIGVNHDIEEQKQAEFYLAEGQRLAHTGSWAFNAAGFNYWSSELFQIYGVDPSGKPPTVEEYLDLVHPEDRDFMEQGIQKMLADHLAFDFTKRIVRPDGEIRRIRCVGIPVTQGGTFQGFLGTGMDVTEHELLTQELRRREAYLAEAQRLSHTGSFGWKPDSGEIVWSDETYRIFEYDHAVKPTIDLLVQRVCPGDRPDFLKVIESASAGATRFEHTYRWLLPDGSVKHLHVLAHALQDASGSREFVGAATDITSIKKAEEELRQSEACLAEAQRLSHTGSCAIDGTSRETVYWSDEMFRLFGFDPQQGLPMFDQWLQRVHPEDRDKVKLASEKTFLTRVNCDVEFRIVKPDGTVKHIQAIGHPVLSATGEFVQVHGTMVDITERRRAEQELQQLVDLVPQLIVVLGPDGKWINANRVAREYTGLTLEEFRSKEVLGRTIHPDDVEKARAARERGLAGSDPFELDARQLGKDGIYRWFLWRYNPLVEGGRVRRWYVSATEIESRKQQEEQVRQENVRLEERTRIARELHDTLLQTVQSASLHLGAALYGVAEDSSVKPRLERILQLISQAVEESRSAIHGLRSSEADTSNLVLALSRIQEEIKVDPDIDFRVVVTGGQKQTPPETQNEIYRIAREALVNAFSHSGAKRVELELEYTEKDLRMCIRDNGCGIDPQMLQPGREGHWGLAGMRERATRLGGLLKISTSAAAGTEVQLSVPGAFAFQVSALNRSA